MADADSEFDMVSHFGAVDELIQLIYQGASKFVLTSAVDSVQWTLHLGLTGAGRWWKGKWTEKDIFKFLGNNRASTKLVEMFAERLADNVIKGELFIGNWNTEQSSDITLTLNPSAKSPVHIPLEELEPKDAAAYAAKMSAEIASQAQKTRGCRLHPSAPLVDPSYHLSSDQQHRHAQVSSSSTSSSTSSTSKGLTKKSAKPIRHEPSVAEIQAGQEITELKAELARAQQEIKEVKRKAETSNPDSLLASRAKTVAPAVRPVKGASLANPNKKARRFQAMEFED